MEISKFYEKLPKSTLIATREYEDKKIYYPNPVKEEALKMKNLLFLFSFFLLIVLSCQNSDKIVQYKIEVPFDKQDISSNKQQSESSMTTIECVECEGMFAVEDTIIHQQYGEERHWCEECYEEKHTQCDCCEDFFFFEEMTDPMNCDHYYCEECAEREFGTCEECEEACSSDAKYCPDCVEKEEKKIYISKNSYTKSQKIERLLLIKIKVYNNMICILIFILLHFSRK